MRKRLLILVTCIALLAPGASFLAWWVTLPPPGITRANYDKIHVGMTRQEVEALLGGPPRNESSDAVVVSAKRLCDDGTVEGRESEFGDSVASSVRQKNGGKTGADAWATDGLLVLMRFDEADRLTGKDGWQLECDYLPQFTHLRRWLGL